MTKEEALTVTMRAIELANRNANVGRLKAARVAWIFACRMSFRCGGLSGCNLGGGAILLPDGSVAWAPVEITPATCH